MDKSRRQDNKRADKQEKVRVSTLLQLITWFKKSFEFKGKASARKLTVFSCFILLNVGFLRHLETGQQIQVEFIMIYSLIIVIGLGFLTAENIVAIIKGRFGGQSMFVDNYENEIYAKRSQGASEKPDNPGNHLP